MSRKRSIEDVTDSEEALNTKKMKIENGISLSSLPPEIFSHHILKFFDFRDWLELAIVCKQWQLAAQQSTLNKQLVYVKPMTEEIACSILSKYNVNTLVIVRKDEPVQLSELQRVLVSSPSVTTLVLDQCGDFNRDTVALNFENIKTLSCNNIDFLPYFPNVERLKLKLDVHHYLRVDFVFENVKEMEINVLPTVDLDFSHITDRFPKVKKLYVNYPRCIEEDWQELEEIGETLGVQVICRNPHFSMRSEVFNLTSLSYHEYFNAFGETPLQTFLELGNPDMCQTLFVQYSSKQYEKDLFHREPQFSFPLRGPMFRTVGTKVDVSKISESLVQAMIECGYVDYWKGLPRLTKTTAIEQMKKAHQYLPPTKHALNAIVTLINEIGVNLTHVVELIGLEALREIAKLKVSGDNLLHLLARSAALVSEDLDLLIKHIDVNVLNRRKQNAATIAFNSDTNKFKPELLLWVKPGALLRHDNFIVWFDLVEAGAMIQSNLYSKKASIHFLQELSVCTSETRMKILKRFDQNYIQRLMRLCANHETIDQMDDEKALELFKELIDLGARPEVHGDKNPLITIIAMADRIEEWWPIIEKYHLDVNAANKDGYTPLMISILNDYYDQAQFVLAKGADPNAIGVGRQGEIRRAVFLPEIGTYAHFSGLLQSYGVDFTVVDENGNTALLNYIKALIEDEFEEEGINALKHVSIDRLNNDNETALSCAIKKKFFGVVEHLLTAGANPNVLTGPLQQSALITACDTGNIELVCWVLCAGTDVDIQLRDKAGRSFMHYLLNLPHILIDNFKPQVNFSELIPTLSKLYNTPENINFIKNELATIIANPELEALKRTLMKMALVHIHVLTALVEVFGVDINMQDSSGNTMLLRYILEETDIIHLSEVIMDYLVTRSDVNHQNRQKKTALMIAVEYRALGTAYVVWRKKLIEAGASLTIKDMHGLSPIEIEPDLKKYVENDTMK